VSKYKAQRTECDGKIFDSKKEAHRYGELKMLERSGIIANLELQPAFEIEVAGRRICKYRADFRYVENGAITVEDVKGVRTPLYRLKKKLVEALYDVRIVEV